MPPHIAPSFGDIHGFAAEATQPFASLTLQNQRSLLCQVPGPEVESLSCLLLLCDFANEVHVGVIVDVLPSTSEMSEMTDSFFRPPELK